MLSTPDSESDTGTGSNVAFGSTASAASTGSYGSAPATNGYGSSGQATTGSAPTSAGGYADEVTPDAPSTTGPTPAGGYKAEVKPGHAQTSIASSNLYARLYAHIDRSRAPQAALQSLCSVTASLRQHTGVWHIASQLALQLSSCRW